MTHRPWLTCLLLMTLSACDRGSAILFPDASNVRVTAPEDLKGQAGEVLAGPIIVAVVDRFGNGISQVAVTLRVQEGGGSLDRTARETDANGVVEIRRWRMGERPGRNSLQIEVAGLQTAVAVVEAGPGPPSLLAALGGGDIRGSVAAQISVPDVRVTDRFSNPVPGVTLRYRASQGGSVADSVRISDSQGVARQSSWTLGTEAGPQALRVTADGTQELVLVAQAAPGPPALFGWDNQDEQAVEAGLFLVHPPVARVTDAFGNPSSNVAVSFTILEGGGRLQNAANRTDSTGRARVERWYLGNTPGTNALRASVTGFPPLELSARALPPGAPFEGRYFSVPYVQVNQATQSASSDIPLVAGRPGVVRVFVQASESGAPAPAVDVVLHLGGQVLHTERLGPPSSSTPTSLFSDLTTLSWNLPIPGDWVQPGLAVEAVVDPDGEVGVTTRRVARFPLSGAPPAMTIVTPPPFRVRFVPLRDRTTGQQGDIHPLNVDAFMEMTRKLLPLGEVQVTIGPPFVTDLLTSTGEVREVLSELLAAWAASSFRDHYFHGIFPSSAAAGYIGLAYVPVSPDDPAPVAQSWDRLPQASATVAHEFGHNLGLRHAPCGNPSGVDPLFPYGSARLGVIGWDGTRRVFINPSEYHDIMSYCAPAWISDYNYRQLLEWRLDSPMGSPMMAAGTSGPGLLVWGRVDESGAHLEPAFPVSAAPLLPAQGGTFQLRGESAAGDELFLLNFEPRRIADGGAPGEGHFAFVIPMPAVDVAQIELLGPGGQSAVRARRLLQGAAAPAAAPPPAALSGAPGAEVLQWDREVFPLAVLRDRDSGEVVGFDRSGSIGAGDLPRDVDVILSDGVQGWRLTQSGWVSP